MARCTSCAIISNGNGINDCFDIHPPRRTPRKIRKKVEQINASDAYPRGFIKYTIVKNFPA